MNLQEHRSENISHIVQDIRLRILLQKLMPGSRLAEVELAKQFQVSRSTLRTALQTLEGEGLILTQPNGRRIVAAFTATSAEDVYQVREMLEQQAIALIIRQNLSNYLPLVQVLDQIAAIARDQQDVRREVCIGLDMAFHRALLSISGSWALIRCWDTLASIMSALLSLNTVDDYQYAYVQEFYAKHKLLFDGIITCSPDLQDQMAIHIRDARMISLDQLKAYSVVQS